MMAGRGILLYKSIVEKEHEYTKEVNGLRKQVNSMQAQLSKQMGKPAGKWNQRAVKSSAGRGGFRGNSRGAGTMIKLQGPCIICKGEHHPGNCESSKKPTGTFCYGCGEKGHKSTECPKKAGGSANAIAAARLKKSVQTGETCTRCKRGIHPAANCTTQPCPECGSLFKHNWNE
jgi:hypothetical protein